MLFRYQLTGLSPLLMHADDVEKSDQLEAWRKDPKNKGVSKSGDDRSPAWTWQTYVYSDGEHVVLPTECLSASLRGAGAMMILKKQKTFKEASQCGLILHEDFLPIQVEKGRTIKTADLDKMQVLPFPEQCEKCRKLGFELFVKRAKIGSSKHVRVRPKFDVWTVSGTVETTMEEIGEGELRKLFELAGFYKGLGDWRPGSPIRPGRFGRFKAEISKA